MIEKMLNRIHCGDCLDIMKTMPDKCVDLILTDPPYGIGVKNHGGTRAATGFGGTCATKVRTHSVERTDYNNFTWDQSRLSVDYFTEMMRVSKNQIIFGGNYYTDYLYPTPAWIFWDKDNGASDFSDGELAWTSFQTGLRKFKWKWNGMMQQDMKNKEKRINPTQKPVKLGIWILKKYAKPGDIIMDCFSGSGSFPLAASMLGFNWIGIEQNPIAVQLSTERIITETKQMGLFHAPTQIRLGSNYDLNTNRPNPAVRKTNGK